MNFITTKLQGCFIIEPELIYDERGYFMKSFEQGVFQEGTKQQINFVQENQSFSFKDVLRGLHYQTGEHAQAKLVRVVQGEVLDVAVDIRPESATYGAHIAVLLSDKNHRQFFIPRGFAHGFVVLSETASFVYKCDNVYNKASEGGIIFNDPQLNIDWSAPAQDFLISPKDLELPSLEHAKKIW